MDVIFLLFVCPLFYLDHRSQAIDTNCVFRKIIFILTLIEWLITHDYLVLFDYDIIPKTASMIVLKYLFP